MSTIEAIKTFFGTTDRPVTNGELMELKRALKTEEWEKIGQDCAKALGATWGKQ